MARNFKIPARHQLAVATLIDFICAHAAETPPATEAQRKVLSALHELDPDRIISRKLLENFKNVPEKNRVRAFGAFSPGNLEIARKAEASVATMQSSLSFSMPDDVGDVIIPNFPDDTEFSIVYTGIYCRDSSGDRFLVGPSDETYVINVAVSIEDDLNVTREELHPVGVPSKHYSDIDDGETRIGPVAVVWSGPEPTREISLVTVVMEHDEGDPNFYKEEIATIVGGAAAVAAALGLVVPAILIAVAGLVVNWLADTDDDILGTSVNVIRPNNFKLVSTHPLKTLEVDRQVLVPLGFGTFGVQTVTDNTGLENHFVEHVDDEADYFMTYKYVTDRGPVAPPPGGFSQPLLNNTFRVVLGN